MKAPVPLANLPISPLDVSFRRLLRKCEAMAAGSDDVWKTDPVFHSYVETMQEQLLDLAATSSAGLQPEVLGKYEEHVTNLLRQLAPPKLPAFCRPVSKLSRLTSHGEPLLPSCARGSAIRSHTNAAASLRESSQGLTQEGQAQPSNEGLNSKMEMHRNLQEDLIDDMADLAKGLKNQSMAVEEHLKRRKGLVDTAEAGVTRSVNTMTKNTALAGKVEQSSRSMTCYTLLVLFWVMAAFLGMAVFIKMSSIAGYRASPSPLGHNEL